MPKKKTPVDFVKWLQSQLKAFRAHRFEELGDELEGVVGRCRHEVRDRAKRLFHILMRREYVYGDWTDLQFEWDMLCSALRDSPSLVKTAQAQIKGASTRIPGPGRGGTPRRRRVAGQMPVADPRSAAPRCESPISGISHH